MSLYTRGMNLLDRMAEWTETNYIRSIIFWWIVWLAVPTVIGFVWSWTFTLAYVISAAPGVLWFTYNAIKWWLEDQAWDRTFRMRARELWPELEATPGFNEDMEQAEADLAAGKGTPFRELVDK